jgi:3-dehydroquinate synthetase
LPTVLKEGTDGLIAACRHDKKTAGDAITVVAVPEVGTFEMKTLPFTEFEQQLRQVMGA